MSDGSVPGLGGQASTAVTQTYRVDVIKADAGKNLFFNRLVTLIPNPDPHVLWSRIYCGLALVFVVAFLAGSVAALFFIAAQEISYLPIVAFGAVYLSDSIAKPIFDRIWGWSQAEANRAEHETAVQEVLRGVPADQGEFINVLGQTFPSETRITIPHDKQITDLRALYARYVVAKRELEAIKEECDKKNGELTQANLPQPKAELLQLELNILTRGLLIAKVHAAFFLFLLTEPCLKGEGSQDWFQYVIFSPNPKQDAFLRAAQLGSPSLNAFLSWDEQQRPHIPLPSAPFVVFHNKSVPFHWHQLRDAKIHEICEALRKRILPPVQGTTGGQPQQQQAQTQASAV